MCCWVRKEYSSRSFFRIYSNRIEVNEPQVRFPFGYLGCGSWNSDKIVVNVFDRGAFGFQHVRAGVSEYLFCCWPVYGGVVARHRCQCNGPLWNRMFTDCGRFYFFLVCSTWILLTHQFLGGWWCDEWICQMMFCTYRYKGLSNPDEVAFAASIALQAYFEGRAITPDDMKKCIEYWRNNISERTDPIGRKRPVCCEPHFVPMPTCSTFYQFTHPAREIPYGEEEVTDHLKEVYTKYKEERKKQIDTYEHYYGPVQKSTICRACGCRQLFGRKGFFFCTEGCSCVGCKRKAGEVAPPFDNHYFDDEYDASSVLMIVLGPPPPNVVIRRWRWDPEKGENYLDCYPANSDTSPIDDKPHHQ